MSVLLLRHGMTEGNIARRYEGCRTDTPLSETGCEALRGQWVPKVDRLYVSPMRRCRETAELLFPDMPQQIVPDLREIDFGLFEGKTANELSGRRDWEAWIASGGEGPFPKGESRREFATRCVLAYRSLRFSAEGMSAVVVHGGTIMAIMEAMAKPARSYFDWHVPCGSGYVLEADGSWRVYPDR